MPEEQEQPQPGQEGKRDLLKTSPAEAAEMQDLIDKGLRAHSTVGALTFAGIVVLLLAGLYYARLDKLDTQMGVQYSDYLDNMVRSQYARDCIAFGAKEPLEHPSWPLRLYLKIRKDIYIISGAVLLLSLVFVLIERAKMRRNSLLVYRALAREIEKLRLRVKQLEGKKGLPDEEEKPGKS